MVVVAEEIDVSDAVDNRFDDLLSWHKYQGWRCLFVFLNWQN
jgi:hypothetical protein